MRTMIAFVLLFATQAQAESWGGRDKWQHAVAGATTGAVFTKITDDWRYGCAAAAAVGLAKELYDRNNRNRHTPSFKDFVVTAAAGCGSSIVVAPNYIGFNIKF